MYDLTAQSRGTLSVLESSAHGCLAALTIASIPPSQILAEGPKRLPREQDHPVVRARFSCKNVLSESMECID